VTDPASAWTVEIESTVGENVDDARLETIADLLDELTASVSALAGPAIGAHVPTGTLRLIITVEAPTPEAAALKAATAFRQVTPATGIGTLRVAAAETLEPIPAGA